MSLATKYRPQTFDDVTEQQSVKTILQQQIGSGEIQHAYLFCGGAGTGKTTTARIFANEINKGQGNPLELDAASNNSVDDVRNIIQQAKVQSMDSEYRIFILDEVHALSNNAWQALLKLLEEPPKKSVFIMCTTDPQKIPKTILSRVQRFDFKRISQQGIVDRLKIILGAEFKTFGCDYCNEKEWSNEVGAFVCKRNGAYSDKKECIYGKSYEYDVEAINYIAKIADGGMRDAITLLDKCLAYSPELTIENVIQALGTVDYEVFFELTDEINNKRADGVIKIIEKVHSDGKDLKQFVKDYMSFLLDVNKYDITHTFDYLQLPDTYTHTLENCDSQWFERCRDLLPIIVKLNADIKWDSQAKVAIEARLLMECIK